MSRYVDIEDNEAFIKVISDAFKECHFKHKKSCFYTTCEDCIRSFLTGWNSFLLPTVDVQEVKHGSWSSEMLSKHDPEYGDYHFGFQCSVCGALMNKTAYCGNCGAKMDGGIKSE